MVFFPFRIFTDRKRKVLFLLFLILPGLFTAAFGQIKAAKNEMAESNYTKAIEILHQFIQKADPKTKAEATLLMADCYRLQNDMQDARAWYFKAIRLGNVAPLTYFYYAKALRACGDYEGAKKIFLRYDSLVPEDHRGKIYASFCDSAIAWDEKPFAFEVNNARNLNSLNSEFGPVFYNDGVMFATDKIMSANEETKSGWAGNGYLKLVFAKPKQKGDYYGDYYLPKLVPEFYTDGSNDGPATFSKDGDEVYITRTVRSSDKPKDEREVGQSNQMKIFSATKTGDKWSKWKPFFFNSDHYSVGYPSLSPDGSSLFFVSDVDGGFGGTDIYVSSRDGNNWDPPANLGPIVNTFGNETFPFVADNGDLYFASDGHPGFGGLDIFVTRKVGNVWLIPQNLGKPINSSYDDFALAMYKNDSVGLFSADRPGGRGEDDIYSFRVVGPLPALTSQPAIASATKIKPKEEPKVTPKKEEVKPAEKVVPVPAPATTEVKPKVVPVPAPATAEVKPPAEKPKQETKAEQKVTPKEEPKVTPKKEEVKPAEKVVPVPAPATAEVKPKVVPVPAPATAEIKPPAEKPKQETKTEQKVTPKEEPKVTPKKEEVKPAEKVVPVPAPATAEVKPPTEKPKQETKTEPKVVPKEEPKVTPKKEEVKPAEKVVAVPAPATAEVKPPTEKPKQETKPEQKVTPKEEPKVTPKKEEVKPAEKVVPVPAPATAEVKPKVVPVPAPATAEVKPAEKPKQEVKTEQKVTPKEEPKVPQAAALEKRIMVSGCIKDGSTQEPLPTATVFFLDENKGKVIVHKANERGCFRSPLTAGDSYRVKAMLAGYSSDCVSFYSDSSGNKTDVAIPNDLLLEKTGVTRSYRVDNIYYDFDRYFIRPDAEPNLKKLVQVMNENPVTVEIGAHADCRGTAEYNMKLTERRAASAANYIVQKGIRESRITKRWYGKSRLTNNCNCTEGTHCTETQHQANRRAEFKITLPATVFAEAQVDLTKYREGDTLEVRLLPPDFFKDCNRNILSGPLAELLKSSTLLPPEQKTNLIYTVQIGAFSYLKPRFNNLNNVMSCKGRDGILRCFVGKFTSKEEAIWYRDHLRSGEFKDAFIALMDENHQPSNSNQVVYLSNK